MKLGSRIIGHGELKEADEVGIWFEAQLELRDEYEKAIYEMAKAGKLGWSSGTAPHLVNRELTKSGKAYHIKAWPLGLDASLTPTPAEPRNHAQSIKSVIQPPQDETGPELDKTSSAEKPNEGGTSPAENIKTLEKETMSDQTTQAPAFDMDKLAGTVGGIIDAKLKAWDEQNREIVNDPGYAKSAPAFNKTKVGEGPNSALFHFLKTGQKNNGLKASNDVSMQAGTDAEGGYAVPTGLHNQIIARVSEVSLPGKLDLMPIPGKGTTVNVALDGEADGEFVATNEEADHDRDTPVIGNAAMTLVRYTKKIPLSWELLDDEDAALEAFLTKFVSRGMAKTHNQLLLAAVAAGGTEFDEFASATAIAAGEPENVVFNDTLGDYLEDDGSIAWVMRPTTFGAVAKLTGDARSYAEQQTGLARRELLGYPVHFSNKAAAIASDAKTMYFGNWSYVGVRGLDKPLTVLRDPYSYEAGIELRYQFRAVYSVLQAGAIGFGKQAT